MQSASRQAVKSSSEAVGLRVVQARSGGRTCRGKKGCRVSRVDFAHGWGKSFTRVATLRSTVEVRVGVSQDSVAEGNCVVARRGGKQPEANWRSAG